MSPSHAHFDWSSLPPLYPVDLSLAEAEAGLNPPLAILPTVAQNPLSDDDKKLLAQVDKGTGQRRQWLRDWVEINSGSVNHQGIARQHQAIAPLLDAMGFAATAHPAQQLDGAGPKYGPQQVYRRPGSGQGPRVLLIGHVDTVYEPGCGFDHARVAGDRLFGPGGADMKGGLVVLISALQSLAEGGVLDRLNLTVLLNGDEEISSRGSRSLIEAEARRADLGLVFEPGRPDPWGAVTVARKGTGAFSLTVEGVAAHSGNRYSDGLSASDVLAQKIVALGRLSDLRRGVSLNVGILRTQPDAKRNKVCDWAQAEFDLRLREASDATELLEQIDAIAGREMRNPWTGATSRSVLSGGLARPPMPLDPARTLLYGQVSGLAALLGQPFGAVSVGGGSDANIAAGQGLLVLDGLGPVGGGLHTFDEWVDLPSLDQRSALTVLLLSRLAQRQLQF